MTQTETVQTVQSLEELQNLGRKSLVALMKQFKAEDTDCLSNVNGKSKNPDLIEALAEYMGFNQAVTAEITEAVNSEIIEAVHPTEEQDVMDLGFEDTPTLETVVDPFADKVEIIMVTDSKPELSQEDAKQAEIIMAEEGLNEAEPLPETTGDKEVDDILNELGLDSLDTINPETITAVEAESTSEPEAEEKPKKKGGRKATIPMDAPIPIREYESLILGIYGNILEPREEPFPVGHKYEGMVHEEVKLERFNPKAHEVFRNTKGNLHLVYTNVGATYLIVVKKPDGTLDPVLEVANKGRGHLRCKQIANALQMAYNEKADQEVIPAETYGKLVEQIETLPINMEGAGA